MSNPVTHPDTSLDHSVEADASNHHPYYDGDVGPGNEKTQGPPPLGKFLTHDQRMPVAVDDTVSSALDITEAFAVVNDQPLAEAASDWRSPLWRGVGDTRGEGGGAGLAVDGEGDARMGLTRLCAVSDWSPEGRADLSWLVATVAGVFDQNLHTGVQTVAVGDDRQFALHLARLRIVLSVGGFAAWGPGLRAAGVSFEGISPDEDYTSWCDLLRAARRLCGWPVVTGAIPWVGLVRWVNDRVGTLPQMDRDGSVIAAADIGEDVVAWLRACVWVAACRMVRVHRVAEPVVALAFGDGAFEVLPRMASHMPAQVARRLAVHSACPDAGGKSVGLIGGMWLSALTYFPLMRAEPIVDDLPAETTELIRGAALYAVNGADACDRLVVPLKTRIGGYLSWQAEDGGGRLAPQVLSAATSSRLPFYRLARANGELGASGYRVDYPEATIASLFASYHPLWESTPEHNDTPYADDVWSAAWQALVAIPVYAGALSDRYNRRNASGYAGYCPLVLISPGDAQLAEQTTDGGKTVAMRAIAAACSLSAAYRWRVHGDTTAIRDFGEDCSAQGRRGGLSHLNDSGMLLFEEAQDTIFSPKASAGSIVRAADLTTIATGGMISWGRAYASELESACCRYGVFAVAKSTSGAMDIHNRAIVLYCHKRQGCTLDHRSLDAMTDGTLSLWCAAKARSELDALDRFLAEKREFLRGRPDLVTEGRRGWRSQTPHLLHVWALTRQVPMDFETAWRVCTDIREASIHQAMVVDGVAGQLGASINARSVRANLDGFWQPVLIGQKDAHGVTLTQQLALDIQAEHAANDTVSSECKGGWVDVYQLATMILTARSRSEAAARGLAPELRPTTPSEIEAHIRNALGGQRTNDVATGLSFLMAIRADNPDRTITRAGRGGGTVHCYGFIGDTDLVVVAKEARKNNRVRALFRLTTGKALRVTN